MQKTRIVIAPIQLSELKEMAKDFSEELVKAVVDIELKKMAIPAGMHVDEEALLLESGSEQQYLWGINIYPNLPKDQWIEFDSMINIRPWQNNRSRGVEDPVLRQRIKDMVYSFIRES